MDKNDIKYLMLSSLGYVERPDFVQTDDNGVKIVNAQYEHILSLCISKYKWNFFTAQAELTAVDNEGKFKYKYELPEDLEFLNNAYADEYNIVLPKFEMYRGYLYTDSPTCFIDYRKKVCEENLAPYFIEFMRLQGAFMMCHQITGDSQLEQALYAKAQQAFIDAQAADNLQKPIKVIDCGVFADVRNW
jgi:hypothetical protein